MPAQIHGDAAAPDSSQTPGDEFTDDITLDAKSKNPPEGTWIDRRVRLSESSIWPLNRKFYQDAGERAWGEGLVPHFVTCNAFIAEAYAEVIVGYLSDWYVSRRDAGADVSGTRVYLVELAGGSGRFGYQLLVKLSRKLDRSRLREVAFTYVLTDLVERNVEHWENHIWFKPMIADGRVDFARFDMERDSALTLRHSGVTLSRGDIDGPLVVIANYGFDSLPQDVYRVDRGQLFERLVSVRDPGDATSPGEDGGDAASPILDRVLLSYESEPTSPPYYDDELWNHILDEYKSQLPSTTVLFPTATLTALHALSELSSGQMMLLTGDKGYLTQESLMWNEDPYMARHGGCISLMVNYHALGRYFELQGGQVLRPQHAHQSLAVAAFILGLAPRDTVDVHEAFGRAIDACGPDDRFLVSGFLSDNTDQASLEQILALLRACACDPYVLGNCLPRMLQLARDTAVYLKEATWQLIHEAWSLYFPIGESYDLPFQIGLLLCDFEYYAEALPFLHCSKDLFGEHETTSYNIGLCTYHLGRRKESLEWFEDALRLQPDFEPARARRIQLTSELASRR